MGEHTVGPWVVPNDFNQTRAIDCASGVVAVVASHTRPDAEKEANARLIATAPDQHRELVRNLADFKAIICLCSVDPVPSLVRDFAIQAIGRIELIIAKATEG